MKEQNKISIQLSTQQKLKAKKEKLFENKAKLNSNVNLTPKINKKTLFKN